MTITISTYRGLAGGRPGRGRCAARGRGRRAAAATEGPCGCSHRACLRVALVIAELPRRRTAAAVGATGPRGLSIATAGRGHRAGVCHCRLCRAPVAGGVVVAAAVVPRPAGAIEVSGAVDAHQVVEVDLVGGLVLLIRQGGLVGHLVGEEQRLAACLAVGHCGSQRGKHHHHGNHHYLQSLHRFHNCSVLWGAQLLASCPRLDILLP